MYDVSREKCWGRKNVRLYDVARVKNSLDNGDHLRWRHVNDWRAIILIRKRPWTWICTLGMKSNRTQSSAMSKEENFRCVILFVRASLTRNVRTGKASPLLACALIFCRPCSLHETKKFVCRPYRRQIIEPVREFLRPILFKTTNGQSCAAVNVFTYTKLFLTNEK